MSRDQPVFDPLLDTVECPACGAEVDPGSSACPECLLNLTIALAPDTRPRLARWMLDGVAIPEWAERPKWLWLWATLYVLVLGAVPFACWHFWRFEALFWIALVIVLAVAMLSWLIAASEIAGDTGSTAGAGTVFVASFFLWPVTAAGAMVYLGRTLPRQAWRALQWANLLCFLALAGSLIAGFIAWMLR